MNARRSSLLVLALSAAAVVIGACSKKSAVGSHSFVAGEYTISGWTGTSGCGFIGASTLDGDVIEIYGTGATLQLGGNDPGIPITVAGNNVSTLVHNPDSFEFFTNLFCILDDQTRITGVINSADQAVLTITDTFNPGSLNVNNQCQWTAGSTPTAYPCVATQTFTINRTGPTNPVTPVPAPATQTGTITASSDTAGLTSVVTDLNPGQALDFNATLGTTDSTESAGDPWYCTAPNGSFSPNYVIFNAIGTDTAFFTTFTMLVATNAWSVGSHPITPETVYLAVGSSSNSIAFAASSGSTGTLVLSSAGTVTDTPGSACRFALTGVGASGVVVQQTGPAVRGMRRPRHGFAGKLH